jgi:mercuric ion transport protein
MEDRPVEHAPTRSPEKALRGWLAAAGLSAILASACCLGPLILTAVGVSALGVSALFAPLRPLFVLLAAASLGAAFYRHRAGSSSCAAGGRCGPDTAGGGRPPARLWLASALVAMVALFPVYGDAWLRGARSAPAAASDPRHGLVLIEIAGMTCAACATGLERALAAVPGVRSAAVDWRTGIATVHTTAVEPPAPQALLAAIERAGYRGRIRRGAS